MQCVNLAWKCSLSSTFSHQWLIEQQQGWATDQLHSQRQTPLLPPTEDVGRQLQGDGLEPHRRQHSLRSARLQVLGGGRDDHKTNLILN